MSRRVGIIGSGFSSLAAACYLAQMGYEVTVLEKNDHLGGRALQWKKDGFTFDMGPTFYWMPDIFERFFNDFGKSVDDFYTLHKLNPAYSVYFGQDDCISIGHQVEDIIQTFERIEPGSSRKLNQFLKGAKDNYLLAMTNLVYQPGESPMEIVRLQTVKKLHLFFQNIKGQAARTVEDKRLRQLLEFPVLFLGAKSRDTPAFYNLMNHADFGLGTWHPYGGMYKVVEAIVKLASDLGVVFQTQTAVRSLEVSHHHISSLVTDRKTFEFDLVLSGADYHHTESLLPMAYRQYSDTYWEKRKFAPSALLFFMGLNKKLKNVSHHTLFFDTSLARHEEAIYDTKTWPEEPLFYANFPSITDPTMAPPGKEAATILIPLAPGLKDSEKMRKILFEKTVKRLEQLTDQDILTHLTFHKSFGIHDFSEKYNAFKGNAYGLANTLRQTHFLRPNIKSRKIDNLYFTGQLTLPGPGVPPSLISGKIASQLIHKYHPAQ